MIFESEKNPDVQRLGSALKTLGDMEHQKEVAREGRSQVNINQEGQNTGLEKYVPAPGCVWANPKDPDDLTVRPSLGTPFAANDWKDFNYNQVIEPNEFAGVKDVFYDNEPIIFGLYPRFVKSARLELYSPNGEKIREGKISKKDAYIEFDPKIDFRGYGTYTAVWHFRFKVLEYGLHTQDYIDIYKSITEIKEFKILPTPKTESMYLLVSSRLCFM